MTVVAFNPVHVREEGVTGDIGNVGAATHAAVTLTYLAAGAGVVHGLYGVSWSYSAVPVGGNIQITDNGSTVFNLDITAAGVGFIPFETPLIGQPNTVMTVVLADGGAGCVGKVNAIGHFTGASYPTWAIPTLDISLASNSGMLAAIL